MCEQVFAVPSKLVVNSRKINANIMCVGTEFNGGVDEVRRAVEQSCAFGWTYLVPTRSGLYTGNFAREDISIWADGCFKGTARGSGLTKILKTLSKIAQERNEEIQAEITTYYCCFHVSGTDWYGAVHIDSLPEGHIALCLRQ